MSMVHCRFLILGNTIATENLLTNTPNKTIPG